MPVVSIIMPVFNAQSFLAAAIESILSQAFRDLEFICVDDGSGDRSLAVLRNYQAADGRLQIITRPHTGIVGALNDGIAGASGKYILRMDADDVAMHNRIERQVDFMNRHPWIVAAGSSVILIDEEGAEIDAVHASEHHEAIDEQFLQNRGCRICHPTAIMRTDAVRRVGGYRMKYQWAEDIDLFLRLGEHGELANLAEPLLLHRIHPSSVCHVRWHSEIVQRQRAAIDEACKRRNVAMPLYAECQIPAPTATNAQQRLEYHRTCSARARFAGHGKAARKHALAALKQAPLSRETWWTWGHAFLGPSVMTCLLGIRSRLRGKS